MAAIPVVAAAATIRDRANSRFSQGTFGTEIGRQIATAEEQPANSLVGVRHEIGNEDCPCELDHRDDADRGLRAIQYVSHDADLVRGLTFGHDHRIRSASGVVEYKQVVEPFHRAWAIDAQDAHEVRSGRLAQERQRRLAGSPLIGRSDGGLEVHDDAVPATRTGGSKSCRASNPV
jgi:hypothetical protein